MSIITKIIGLFGNSSPDSKAEKALQEIQEAPTPETRGGFCKLICKLIKLKEETTDKQLLAKIENELSTRCRQYRKLCRSYVDCLDSPFAEREELYREMASRDSARDTCHLGELLLMRDDNSGTKYITRAAQQGDSRALYIAAKLHVEGMFDCEQDKKKARDLLIQAAQSKYAPALEMLAALHWDGDGNWNFNRNREKALQYMTTAAQIYSMYKFVSEKHQRDYADYCACMNHIAAQMQSLINGGLELLPEGFYPSFLALRLSYYPLNEEGLRARAHYICEYMSHYGKTFYLGDYLWNVRLPLISLSIEDSNDQVLGLTRTWMDGKKIRFHISIMPQSIQRTNTLKTYWLDEESVNTTIAHELAHCYLFKEYNYRLNQRHPEYLTILEGHATNCEYQFCRLVYHKGCYTRKQFARPYAHLSRKYAEYFNTFCDNFIDYDDMLNWDTLHNYIYSMGSDHTRVTMEQVINSEPFTQPIFYGLGFNIYQ